MFGKIRSFFGDRLMTVSILFAIIYLVAWFFNGVYSTEFDLNALQGAYGWIGGLLGFKHTVDSGLNSKLGEKIK